MEGIVNCQRVFLRNAAQTEFTNVLTLMRSAIVCHTILKAVFEVLLWKLFPKIL